MSIGRVGKQAQQNAKTSISPYNASGDNDDNLGVDTIDLTPPSTTSVSSSTGSPIRRSSDPSSAASGSMVLELPRHVQRALFGDDSATPTATITNTSPTTGPSSVPTSAVPSLSGHIQREPDGESSSSSSSSDSSNTTSGEKKTQPATEDPEVIQQVAQRVYELMLRDLHQEQERLGKRRF